MTVIIACCLWAPNSHSHSFSRMYDESWVDKLYRGWARNLTRPFRFVCFTDREREFSEPVEQERLLDAEPDYGALIEPFKLDKAVIITGLDTIVTGNCDHFVDWIENDAHTLAVPRDPFNSRQVCNGVALVPEGLRARMWDKYDGRNDMDWIRANPHECLDDLFPGQIVSYKGSVRDNGLGDARIVYFHGLEKPHEVGDDWIKEHWR